MSGSPGLKRRIRALVVEDSGFMRRVIRGMLASDPQIEVVGHATDGLEAVRAVAWLRPDVVTMDVHMPRADGLVAVARIMNEHPTPILMVSSHTRDGSTAAIRALELGAVDFVVKPSGRVDLGFEGLRDELVHKVKVAARVRPIRTPASVEPATTGGAARSGSRSARPEGGDFAPCVVIGASTGGPAALLQLVPGLPADLRASLLIVQHMPAPYTGQLARELASRAAVQVKEAQATERLARGTAYVAPGGSILTLTVEGRVVLTPASRAAAGTQAVNRTMASVAASTGAGSLGVILTGMGRDGVAGAEAIKQAGGTVFAQDEASCLVYGMPRAAVEAGWVDAVVPLDRIPQVLLGSLAASVGAGPDR